MKNELKRISTTLLLVSMLFLSSFVFLPEETKAATPAATISYNPPMKREANIAPGEDGLAQFDGTVTVDIMGYHSIKLIHLNIRVDTEAGWPVLVNPTSLILDLRTSNSAPFFAEVKVPSYTPSSLSSKITVSGTCVTYPGARQDVFSGDAIIIIQQYFDHRISCDENFKRCHPGDNVKFDIEMLNTGNGDDELELDILKRKKWERRGWKVHGPLYEIDKDESIVLNTTRLSMREKGLGSFVVDVPQDIEDGEYRMTIQTRSVAAEETEDEIPVKVLEVVIVVEKDLVRYLFLPTIILIEIVVLLSLVIKIRTELKNEIKKIGSRRRAKKVKSRPKIKYKKLKRKTI